VIDIAKSKFLVDDGEGKLSVIPRSGLIETLRMAQNLISNDYSGIPVHSMKKTVIMLILIHQKNAVTTNKK
jgi:hypothetical protein